MKKPLSVIILLILFSGIILFSAFNLSPGNEDLKRAKSTLSNIFRFYDSGHDNLLDENYPDKPGNTVSYLAGGDTVKTERVAYLWPTSGVYSAANALYRATNDKKYLKLINDKVMPGLFQYFYTIRKPACYQSYISKAGLSDRYYDDNIWLALDFCETYMLSGKKEYLNKSIITWQFVISGWDDELGGGIYWCEQKKKSKNTCSNAPASVLALKLYEATGDSSYFKWGLRIYNWTKTNLQDSTDFLYFDNKNLSGRIEKKKYTYNSGQMLQASALLYKLKGDKSYLEESRRIAAASIDYFTEDFTTSEGTKIRLFKNTGNWFNAVLLRGYSELYKIDGNDRYIKIFRDNMNQLWSHVRDADGLFSKDWKAEKSDKYKWLLDQASLVEMWAALAEADKRTLIN